MLWGYYCRTCDKRSCRFYDSADGPRQDLKEIGDRVEGIALGRDTEALPDPKIPVLIFLSQHSGHDIWAECEAATLKFSV